MEDQEIKVRLTNWITDCMEKKENHEISVVVQLAFQAKTRGLELIILLGVISVEGLLLASEGRSLWLALTIFCTLVVLFSIGKMIRKGIVEYQARLPAFKRGDVLRQKAEKIVKRIPHLDEDDLWLLTRILNLASAGLVCSPQFRAEVQEARGSPKLERLGRLLKEIIDAYFELMKKNGSESLLFLFDEIQKIENWQAIIKRYYDLKYNTADDFLS